MIYDNETCSVLIDARELCDLANKSGDIDSKPFFLSNEPCKTSEIYEKIYEPRNAAGE